MCERAFADFVENSGLVEKDIQALTTFQEASSEIRSIEKTAACHNTHALAAMQAWAKAVRLLFLEPWLPLAVRSVKEVADKLALDLIEVKPIVKNFDARKAELINYEKKNEVTAAVKALTSNSGIKRLGKYLASLPAETDGDADCPITDCQRVHDNAIVVRQKARFVISCRTATIIIDKKKKESVDSFFTECRMLKVTVPTELKRRLGML